MIFTGDCIEDGERSKMLYPYVVSLNGQVSQGRGIRGHFCAGVIIRKNYILTSAHCAERY